MKTPNTIAALTRYIKPQNGAEGASASSGGVDPADTLRDQLQSVAGTLPAEVAGALIRHAARERSGAALVAFAQDRLIDLSPGELRKMAALVVSDDPKHAAWLQSLAQQAGRPGMHPGALAWGSTICEAWEQAGTLQPHEDKKSGRAGPWSSSGKKASGALALAQQGVLQAALEPGCSIATRDAGARQALQAALQQQGLAASLYAELTARRDVAARLPFDIYYSRMGEVTAALVGASLQVTRRGDIWQRTLRHWLVAHDDKADIDMVAALMPHGRDLADLRDSGCAWVAWLCDLHGLWQSSAPQCQIDLQRFAQRYPLDVALALSALYAVAATGVDGWDVVLQLERLDAKNLDTCIEALLSDGSLRQRLRKNGSFVRSDLQDMLVAHDADMRLASTLQHALGLSDGAVQTYRRFRDARAGALKDSPEVALLLACVEETVHKMADAEGVDAQRLKAQQDSLTAMLSSCGSDLELIEMHHAQLHDGILASAPKPLPTEPVVHAFLDPNPWALWAVRPGIKHTITRYQLGSVQELKALLLQDPIDLARVRQVFAMSRPARRQALCEAMCADADNLLWPLFALNAGASPNMRRKLGSGLPLLDEACDAEPHVRRRFEHAIEMGLSPIEAAHAAQLGSW